MRFSCLRLVAVPALLGFTAGCGESDPTNPSDGPLGVRSVRITPRADTILITDTTSLADTVRVVGTAVGMGGEVLAVAMRYVSTDTTVATVDENGLVTAHGIGTTLIMAQAGGEEQAATITVARKLYTIAVTPSPLSGVVGDTVRVTATARDGAGSPVSGVAFTFESSNPSVATVDAEGLVSFLDAGTVTISARDPGPTPAGTLLVTSFSRDLLSVDVGADHACGVGPLDRAFCWGIGNVGQLGVPGDSICFEALSGTARCELSPKRLSAPSFVSITAGSGFSCGVTSTSLAYCWGTGANGRLGHGNTTRSDIPTLVTGGLTFRSLSAGGAHACGIAQGGIAYCWGSDSTGQLGDFTRTTNSTTPIPVVDQNQVPVTFDSISAGDGHSCALRGTTVFCWGDNSSGQLGRAGAEAIPLAVTEAGVGFRQVTAGGRHTCALASDGRAFCWGDNEDGQLGLGIVGGTEASPIAVEGNLTFVALSAGAAHTCGLVTGGDAYCWGRNNFEQSGGVGAGSSDTPRLVPGGFRFRAISAGLRTTCAVAIDGTGVYCWGSNIFGTLGNALQTATRGVPVPATVLQ